MRPQKKEHNNMSVYVQADREKVVGKESIKAAEAYLINLAN
jgi:hypothetical protein